MRFVDERKVKSYTASTLASKTAQMHQKEKATFSDRLPLYILEPCIQRITTHGSPRLGSKIGMERSITLAAPLW